MFEYQPELTDDPSRNAAVLRKLLAAEHPGRVSVPPGRWPVAGGLVLGDDWSLNGPQGDVPQAALVQTDATEEPFVHVLGSRTAVRDLMLEVPLAYPGPHDGDRWTAVTIGRYLYSSAPAWIEDVTVRRVHVARAGQCSANSIAVMGAVRGLDLADVHIAGGGTGVAVHWGAPGQGVNTLTGPSVHPHLLEIRDLYVRKAYEGFYLSSVHDVSVTGSRMSGVEIGFRLLPGDNTDRFHESGAASPVSSKISVRDCEIGWTGGLYALRVAGWGRSEVDRQVTQLDYRDLTISDVVIHPWPQPDTDAEEGRVAVVIENAGSVAFERLSLADASGVVPVRIDGRDLPLSALAELTDTMS